MRTELTKTDIIFQVYDWLNAGVYFNSRDIQRRCECSRITALRAIRYLKEERHMNINYDRLKGTYIIGDVTPLTDAERNKRSYINNYDKIRYKSHLKNVFGSDWKAHYKEGDENERS